MLHPLVTLLARGHWLGEENLPETGGAVVASTHLSAIDPIFLAYGFGVLGRQAHFMAKASLFRVPVVGRLFKMWQFIPVERSQGADSLASAREEISSGKLVVIYPEGTYTRDPAYWPMTAKTGAVRLALDTGVPLIPVVQWGAQDSMDRYSKRLSWRRPKVYARILPPIDLSDLAGTSDDHESVRIGTERLQEALLEGTGQLRGELPPPEVWNSHNPSPDGKALGKLSKWRRQLARINRVQDVLPATPEK